MDVDEASRQRVDELRRLFDESFAAEPRPISHARNGGGIIVRRGRHIYALDLGQLSGIEWSKGITPIPGRPRSALGLAVGRDRLIPVFDLPALLGDAGDPLDVPGLLLLHDHQGATWAFACDAVVGRVDLPSNRGGEHVPFGERMTKLIDLGECRDRLAPHHSETFP